MDYEFPGWKKKKNQHGSEFDKQARKRMISGSETLLPTLYKYKAQIGNSILEIGPFFNPLVEEKNFPKKNICYWENDNHVIEWLKRRNKNNHKIKPIYCDLNEIDGESQMQLKHETEQYFSEIGNKEKYFDAVIISQVFNYVDYKMLMLILRNFVNKGGLIFVNNVVDYGLPQFFSKKRPSSIEQTIDTIRETGYEIIEKHILESPYPEAQESDRLILVARKE